jgi:hypothetical protein
VYSPYNACVISFHLRCGIDEFLVTFLCIIKTFRVNRVKYLDRIRTEFTKVAKRTVKVFVCKEEKEKSKREKKNEGPLPIQ